MKMDKVIGKLAARLPAFEPGHVWLAGAGPGDAGQITLEVAAALGQADAIVYDALVDPSILEAAEKAELHFAGKRGGKASAHQDDITALIIRLANEGKRVLRLKGGDPFVFGRGGEEAFALVQNGIPFRILPGLTAGLAGLAGAHIPATMRGINKAIILATGHAAGTDEDLDWAALAATGQPIVVYMGLKNLETIVAALSAGGLAGSTPSAIVTSAATERERVVTGTLETISGLARSAGLEAPALIVVGGIVAMRAELTALHRMMRTG
ncbi:MAG: uroporphyrinogen-III C-methyltransferase [Mesorhizobium sp.]|nr:uroporphyrinogen-III C-methyltransferase [Mesorhizobium sp.]